MASLEVRLAMGILKKIFDRAKLKASVKRSSVDNDVTVVVSVFEVEGVAGTDGGCRWTCFIGETNFGWASLKMNFDCFSCKSVSSSDLQKCFLISLGCGLKQQTPNEWHTVAFESRFLNSVEDRYSINAQPKL